jgi:MFS family permease
MIGILWAGAGYVIGALCGGFLVSRFSSNTHDRSIEATMTGAFVIGPIIAILALAFSLLRSPRSP